MTTPETGNNPEELSLPQKAINFAHEQFNKYADRAIGSSAFYADDTPILGWPTEDGGTIVIIKIDEGKNLWSIDKFGPSAEGFMAERKAYAWLDTRLGELSMAAGGFALKDFSENSDDNEQVIPWLLDQIEGEPMSADDLQRLAEERLAAAETMVDEMHELHINGTTATRDYRRDYARRREAAIKGDQETASQIDPSDYTVNVAKIPIEEVLKGEVSVDLGPNTPSDVAINKIVQNALRGIQNKAEEAYLLSWRGSKVPRGAKIDGREIAWTQHGIVTDTEGEQIGTYTRLEEMADQEGHNNTMLVFPSFHSQNH